MNLPRPYRGVVRHLGLVAHEQGLLEQRRPVTGECAGPLEILPGQALDQPVETFAGNRAVPLTRELVDRQQGEFRSVDQNFGVFRGP